MASTKHVKEFARINTVTKEFAAKLQPFADQLNADKKMEKELKRDVTDELGRIIHDLKGTGVVGEAPVMASQFQMDEALQKIHKQCNERADKLVALKDKLKGQVSNEKTMFKAFDDVAAKLRPLAKDKIELEEKNEEVEE